MKVPKQPVSNSVGIEIKPPSGFTMRGSAKVDVHTESEVLLLNIYVTDIPDISNPIQISVPEKGHERHIERIGTNGFMMTYRDRTTIYFPPHSIKYILF